MLGWKKIIGWAAAVLLALLVVDIGRYFFYPNVARLATDRPGKTAFMEYREEMWQDKGIKKKIATSWVPLSQVSPYVVKAVIIAEDDKFWSHEGFDFEAMQKALEKDLRKKKFKAGGSTISQQLAKNLYLSPAKNPVRKIKEAILTWRIERQLSKKRIMELYLNVAEWGDGQFGVGLAARKYYGKSAASLGPREASELAAALPNPKRFNPDKNSRYAAGRAERIYQIMVRRGIVIEEYDEVLAEEEVKPASETAPAGETNAAPAPVADPAAPEIPEGAGPPQNPPQ
ncbi:MAG: monofunctional biosynthetic peptidoglycan transglycosylase [Syntrophaceae bacterium]|jgi:monofunctional biosynthetic peptidoglycan transglycosylase|nr:monofunctional biosynthetic peptidoglycan transglycosylase [Syntrophaceae bacterium]